MMKMKKESNLVKKYHKHLMKWFLQTKKKYNNIKRELHVAFLEEKLFVIGIQVWGPKEIGT